jgi:predicted dehydrogenase
MIVATALRLADHLKERVLSGDAGVAAGTGPISVRDRYAWRVRSAPSPNAVKVGFVGAGRRISDVYLPILRQMPEEFEAVGFTTHSPASTRRFESATGVVSFPMATDLLKQARPDFVVLAVPDRQNEATIAALLDLKIPILAETPLAWSASGTRRVIERAKAGGVVVGVAEQFPFLPLDQFRKQLVNRGVLGDVYAVLNDFQSYSYHGIAQLRSYLRGRPVTCQCTEFDLGRSPNGGFASRWQSGSVVFDDGSLLLHQFGTPALGCARSTRIYGRLGVADGAAIHLFTAPNSGQFNTFQAQRLENAAGHLASISADLGEHGTVAWENPFAAYRLSDEQIAVASLLRGMSRAVREGAPPLYAPADFLRDIEVVQAFRYSAARNGAAVGLPVGERAQRALQLASPRYWKRIFS